MAVIWACETLLESVTPLLPGFTIEVVPVIDSTNSELMRRARMGSFDPILLVAEHQTAGRGRVGRNWEGGASASLTFSLGLPLAPAHWSGLSLAVGLAVVESLHPALQLKWPNDVWFKVRKLAGILVETASIGEQRYAVIGVGINMTPRGDQGLRTAPAALSEILPGVDAPAALASLVLPLVRCLQGFEKQGFAPLRAAFHCRDLLYGREVVCSDGLVGTARGVDATGALLVHTADGPKKVSSAEVSVRPAPPTVL
jgi:BirA family biotin operon repressor/biotin-[acetyl-CoA-carboxylase] ligase